MRHSRRIRQGIEQQSFVVAAQRHEGDRDVASRQPVDYGSRVRPAIDIVAKEDGLGLDRRRGRKIRHDQAHQSVQAIRETVNVANRVNAPPRLQFRRGVYISKRRRAAE